MTLASWMLLADGVTRTFQWRRIQSNDDWIVPVVAGVVLVLFVRWMYRRDAADWPPVVGWMLTGLRTLVILGLLVLYLQPQWRIEHEAQHNSRVLLLVDTSMSMGLADTDSQSFYPGKSRAYQVAAALGESDLLGQLRKTHDVAVLQFNDELDAARVVALAKYPAEPQDESEGEAATGSAEDSPGAESLDAAHAVRRNDEGKDIAWTTFLTPRGNETRLGEALRQLINDESGKPVSAIVVFSDGGQNAGVAPDAAVELAREEDIPIYAVGLGSDKVPSNVRVSNLNVPLRAYPGDKYEVTGEIQADGAAGQTVTVELLSRVPGDDPSRAQPGTGQLEDRQQVVLGEEPVVVRFELTPEQLGRRVLCLRVKGPKDDANPDDDFREGEIEIVDRKNRVLIFAGGPMREYRFLRNMLYRDRTTIVDVLLQTAQAGISQDAHKLLDDFPATPEEMFQYDCVVAFDPDWQDLSQQQIDLLEAWVAEQGGGLVVVAGPVHTGKSVTGWVEDPKMAKIRALYPVQFGRSITMRDESMVLAREPWPLDFTRKGLDARYLWLDDAGTAWASFEGVYGYFPVRGAKMGAETLARYSDPRTAVAGELPVFFAIQFYGSGRVFYIGSAEMWRLRKLDDTYFEKFYTKLIRHVSQGRLLRGSRRGALLVGQDTYRVGDTVEVRAQLTNAQAKPLEAPGVDVQVIRLADHGIQTVRLEPDLTRPGMFAGRFPVLREGEYRLELPIPESADERLVRRIEVAIPNLEKKRPQRNDAILSRIAERTGGRYYVGMAQLLAPTPSPFASLLKDRTRTTIEPEEPDPRWQETWRRWLMIVLCGLLCVEWLTRRLLKLA